MLAKLAKSTKIRSKIMQQKYGQGLRRKWVSAPKLGTVPPNYIGTVDKYALLGGSSAKNMAYQIL